MVIFLNWTVQKGLVLTIWTHSRIKIYCRNNSNIEVSSPQWSQIQDSIGIKYFNFIPVQNKTL